MTFPNAEAICRVKEPLHWTEEKNSLFLKACQEMAYFHAEHSKEIQHLYRKHRFNPAKLTSESDLEQLPSVGVTAMKYFLLLSLPEEQAVLKLTSSGTRGQKTQIWFDEASLSRVQAQLDGLWAQEGLVSEVPTNYACFIYDATQAKDLGIAFSVKNEQRFTPVARSFFTVRKKGGTGEWQFERELTLSTLKEYAEEGRPVRLLGIPSFIHELLQGMDTPIALPPRSYLLTGGGWKAAEDKKITREAFRSEVEKWLGIPESNQRDGFGMAEHSAPYIECRLHRFHVPVYNRILARDPVTSRALPPGVTGLLQFVTPFNAMMPTLSILSTDLGHLDKEPCPCGWRSPTFTLVGRGGLVKHKGCAITAGEIVRRN